MLIGRNEPVALFHDTMCYFVYELITTHAVVEKYFTVKYFPHARELHQKTETSALHLLTPTSSTVITMAVRMPQIEIGIYIVFPPFMDVYLVVPEGQP